MSCTRQRAGHHAVQAGLAILVATGICLAGLALLLAARAIWPGVV